MSVKMLAGPNQYLINIRVIFYKVGAYFADKPGNSAIRPGRFQGSGYRRTVNNITNRT